MPEPGHRRLPGMTVGRAKPLAEGIEQFGLKRGPWRRQPQQLLSPVKRPCLRFHQPARCQFGQHAAQGLLGYREQSQQRADRQTGLARNKIKRAVMSAAKPLCIKKGINTAREVTIAEI